MTKRRKVKLSEIAEILNGVPDIKQSEYVDNATAITYNYIQPNHLGDFNEIRDISTIKRQAPVDDSYLIRENDILLKRLNPDTATLVGQNMLNTIFSSNLFLIRLVKKYYPAYIACLLESQGIIWLKSNIVGSVKAIKSISIKTLSELDIPFLDYNQQKAIGELWLLGKRRKRLFNDLITENQRLMAAIINSMTKS